MLTMYLIGPVLVLVILSLYWTLYRRPRRMFWAMANQIPGPKPYPLIGNCLLLSHPNMAVTLDVMSGLFKEYGPVVRLWFVDKLNVLLSHPDDIQQVLGNPRIRNRDYRISLAATPFLGHGLFTSRGDDWKKQRKLATPLFHFKILDTYIRIFGQQSLTLADQLDAVADGKSFDIHKYLSLCTLGSICKTALGTTTVSDLKVVIDLETKMDQITNQIYQRVCLLTILPECMSWCTFNGPSTRKSIKEINTFCKQVAAQKLEEYRNNVQPNHVLSANGKSIRSSLDVLIEASESEGSLLSPQDLQDAIITLAGAGTETTASSMSFLLLLVAIHPEIQQQVADELADIFGSDSRSATSEDLQRMHVLDRVIKETLRHFPIGTFIGREISENVDLPSGHRLPKGCTVMIPSYVVHMREDYYQQPNKFWPDRWLHENSPPSHPYSYLPFSAGLRNCVGRKYAMLQMKTVLSTMLRCYKVTTAYTMEELKKQELTATMTLAGTGMYQIQLEKR